jgi:hypothetical protein
MGTALHTDETLSDGGLATESTRAATRTSASPCCEKCHAPLHAGGGSICPRCGWYAVAKTFVAIDRNWDADDDAKQARGEGIPGWAWIVIAGVLAVIVESTAVRLATPDGSSLRSTWAGAQLLAGMAAFVFCQIVGFVVLMRNDSSAALLDVILKPFKISGVLFRSLPRRTWAVTLGVSGLAAVASAALVIGSVPYHWLWSWNVDYRSSQALESAVGQQLNPSQLPEAAEKDTSRQTITCVIIGYELNDDGTLRVVLVARESFGKLIYAGGVAPTGEAALLFELRENLLQSRSQGPVIPMTFNSNWVLPKYTCQISYGFEQDNQKLTDLRWEGDVREMRMK